MLHISTQPACFHINISTKPLLENSAVKFCVMVNARSVKGEAGMCLDDYDFPLPAVGRDIEKDIQKRERHTKERMRGKGEQQ